MDVREKLVELLNEVQETGVNEIPAGFGCTREYVKNEKVASHLIAHGVTVQDGKPLEAFLHPIDAYKGLKAKYLVFKADTGKVVDNCFVLRPDKDVAAVEALRAYANATDNKTLAEDIYSWVGKGEPVQEWISVKEPPKKRGEYLCYFKYEPESPDVICQNTYYGSGRWMSETDKVTHWIPLPELTQPPKGE